MTSYTSPDLLPAPNDYGASADVPNAIDALADATQVALNKKQAHLPTTAVISRLAGWQGAASPPTIHKIGRMVILAGWVERDANLSVTANTGYDLGTLPAGYRPPGVTRTAGPWSSAGARHVGHIWFYADGTITWFPTVNASLTSDDWVAFGGITFVTP